MGVAQTSIENYVAHKASGKLSAQQLRLLGAFKIGHDYSRSELAKITGMPLSSVCGRVNELVNRTPALLCEGPKRECRVTGKTVHPVFRVPDLFT